MSATFSALPDAMVRLLRGFLVPLHQVKFGLVNRASHHLNRLDSRDPNQNTFNQIFFAQAVSLPTADFDPHPSSRWRDLEDLLLESGERPLDVTITSMDDFYSCDCLIDAYSDHLRRSFPLKKIFPALFASRWQDWQENQWVTQPGDTIITTIHCESSGLGPFWAAVKIDRPGGTVIIYEARYLEGAIQTAIAEAMRTNYGITEIKRRKMEFDPRYTAVFACIAMHCAALGEDMSEETHSSFLEQVPDFAKTLNGMFAKWAREHTQT